MKKEIKVRLFPEENYRAVWCGGKTVRFQLDSSKPIGKIKYPEFLDLAINSLCNGKCPYCYANALTSGKNYDNILDKAREYFGKLSLNQRPFQIAIGANGEPSEHPDFLNILRVFDEELEICPNYTTNGMWVDKGEEHIKDLIDVTKKHCGGVAISCHPHLERQWKLAANHYSDNNIRLNFHNIISNRESIDTFIDIFNEYKDKVEYFVLLPYSTTGRALHKDVDWDYLSEKCPKSKQISFGANFYPYLMKDDLDMKLSLYEPEIFSGYLNMNKMTLHKSSFDLTER